MNRHHKKKEEKICKRKKLFKQNKQSCKISQVNLLPSKLRSESIAHAHQALASRIPLTHCDGTPQGTAVSRLPHHRSSFPPSAPLSPSPDQCPPLERKETGTGQLSPTASCTGSSPKGAWSKCSIPGWYFSRYSLAHAHGTLNENALAVSSLEALDD